MPRELPGLYWDEEKQRYFPISARPAGQVPQPRAPQARSNARAGPSTRREHAKSPLYAGISADLVSADSASASRRRVKGRFALSYGATNYAQIKRAEQQNMDHCVTSLSEGKAFWHGDCDFTAPHVSVVDDTLYGFTGDKQGWLQTHVTNPHGYPCGSLRKLSLGEEVSDFCQSGTLQVAVSFGSIGRMAMTDLADDSELWTVINIGNGLSCHDVRTAHLRGRSFVMGAAKRGIFLPDIQANRGYTNLPTGSDVLSIHQLENTIYTGARNGSIQCFDKRAKSQDSGSDLLDGRHKSTTSSITHLNVPDDYKLLASTIRGDLDMFDLRFLRKGQPFLQFDGHVNEYTLKLGIATSPCNNYLFAAGQDRHIRAWSLHTGRPIVSPNQSPPPADPDLVNLSQALPEPIVALQVTEGGGGGGASPDGMSLWAASGKQIFRYWLGQRLDPIAMRY